MGNSVHWVRDYGCGLQAMVPACGHYKDNSKFLFGLHWEEMERAISHFMLPYITVFYLTAFLKIIF